MSDFVVEELKKHLSNCADSYFEAEEFPDWKTVEEEDWVQDGKYQTCTVVVSHVPTGRHFTIHQSRSGSYHTDWFYNDPVFLSEVVKDVKTIQQEYWKDI